MPVPANGPRRLGFGLFQADLPARRLFRRGVLIHIQDQPFQILSMLLEQPGEVVTREELRRRLWPADTFVDFDEGLNTAIKKLRYALGDSPDNPAFIETVPRRGYRLIAPVRVLDDAASPDDHRDAQLQTGELAGLIEALKLSNPPQELDPTSAVSLSPAALHDRALDHSPTAIAEKQQPPSMAVVASPRNYHVWALWTLAVLLCAVALGLGANFLYRDTTPQPSMHFSVALPAAVRDVALSHNGRILAFVAPLPKIGATALWVIEVGGSGSHSLPYTEGAAYPFWSPDDKFIAFFADGKLKKIAASGGAVQVVCDAPIGRGGAWNRDGVIVFAPLSGVAMSRVWASGGPVRLVDGFEQKLATTLSNRWPVFLPDGKHFLYTSIDFGADLRGEANGVYVASLDSPEHKRLVTANSNSAYLPSGYLLFARNNTLLAQRFDAERLQVMGEAFAVANDTEYLSSVARALFTASENGTLVYQSGSEATASQLAWFDRTGKQMSTLGAPARYANPRLSPDGRRVAVDIDDSQSSNTDIWVIDAARPVRFRFTFDPGQDEAPLWSRDAKRILWLSDRGGNNRFYEKASDGSSNHELPTAFQGTDLTFASAPSDWSSDGRFLLYTDLQDGQVLHLWVLPMSGEHKPFRFRQTAYADVEAQFSPDAHWVAYSSNESGRWQVYVAPFPGPGGTYQISTDGGQEPRWRRDGHELFFLSLDRKLMAARVETGSTFKFQSPLPLFETRAHQPITAEEFFTYDVSRDGQRFLINRDVDQNESRPVDIILNWSGNN